MADDRAVFIQDRNYLCFINNCIFVRGGIILPVYSFEVVLEFQNDLFAGLYFSFQVFVVFVGFDLIVLILFITSRFLTPYVCSARAFRSRKIPFVS